MIISFVIGYSVDSGIFDSSGQVMYVAGAPRYNIASGQVGKIKWIFLLYI